MRSCRWGGTIGLAGLLLAGAGCTALQQLAALRQVDFSLAGVATPRLAGIDLSRIRSYSDLTAGDVARLGLALASKDVPFEAVVNVRAENPASNNVTARMVRLQWALLLQNKETVSGALDQPVVLPPGQPETVPVSVRVNLVQFFGGSARDLVDLALAVTGASSTAVTIALRAVPTIETPIGPMTYPEPITISRRL
jgi:hypothetical protein